MIECPICEEKMDNETLLIAHALRHHILRDKGWFKCWCGFSDTASASIDARYGANFVEHWGKMGGVFAHYHAWLLTAH